MRTYLVYKLLSGHYAYVFEELSRRFIRNAPIELRPYRPLYRIRVRLKDTT
jgi:hypothetical protein